MVKLYDGKGTLYQGCHPIVYGYEYAWKAVQVIVDCDNEWDNSEMYKRLKGGKRSIPPIPEGKIQLKWKIEDGNPPNCTDLFIIGKTIASFIKRGKSVLIHCAAGQNRSALVAGAALFYIYGGALSGEHIYRIIKESQPMALTNYSFKNIVQTIEQQYAIYGV